MGQKLAGLFNAQARKNVNGPEANILQMENQVMDLIVPEQKLGLG